MLLAIVVVALKVCDVACNLFRHKKTVNDERNVERAQDELATSQVEVSVAEFAKVINRPC